MRTKRSGQDRDRLALRLSELRQQRGDLPVPALGGVLVPHRGLRGGMPQPGHQFGQRCAGCGGQHRAGVTQIVEPEIRATSCLTCRCQWC